MDMLKKMCVRPRAGRGNRNMLITIWLTEDEYKLVLAMVAELGVNKAQLIRSRLIDNAAGTIINAREMINRLDEIGAEMGRSGKNINQLAKYVNAMKKTGALATGVAEKFNLLLETYSGTYQALEVAIRRIILAMGK